MDGEGMDGETGWRGNGWRYIGGGEGRREKGVGTVYGRRGKEG